MSDTSSHYRTSFGSPFSLNETRLPKCRSEPGPRERIWHFILAWIHRVPFDDLAATLTRHGVPAEVLSIRSDKPTVVDELASQVLEFGADLVVMGCYGHSRFREFLFGGTTQGMLQKLPVPLLMAS